MAGACYAWKGEADIRYEGVSGLSGKVSYESRELPYLCGMAKLLIVDLLLYSHKCTNDIPYPGMMTNFLPPYIVVMLYILTCRSHMWGMLHWDVLKPQGSNWQSFSIIIQFF